MLSPFAVLFSNPAAAGSMSTTTVKVTDEPTARSTEVGDRTRAGRGARRARCCTARPLRRGHAGRHEIADRSTDGGRGAVVAHDDAVGRRCTRDRRGRGVGLGDGQIGTTDDRCRVGRRVVARRRVDGTGRDGDRRGVGQLGCGSGGIDSSGHRERDLTDCREIHELVDVTAPRCATARRTGRRGAGPRRAQQDPRDRVEHSSSDDR